MQNLKRFIVYLSNLDLSANIRKTANDMYNELETVDVDLDEIDLQKSKIIPNDVKVKIIDLIELYWEHADDCINHYSDNETCEFLKQLKDRANEVYSFAINLQMLYCKT